MREWRQPAHSACSYGEAPLGRRVLGAFRAASGIADRAYYATATLLDRWLPLHPNASGPKRKQNTPNDEWVAGFCNEVVGRRPV